MKEESEQFTGRIAKKDSNLDVNGTWSLLEMLIVKICLYSTRKAQIIFWKPVLAEAKKVLLHLICTWKKKSNDEAFVIAQLVLKI